MVVHGTPAGAVGRGYRAGWRLVSRALGEMIAGEGPMPDAAAVIRAAGFRVVASRRLAGVYWSQVVAATAVRAEC